MTKKLITFVAGLLFISSVAHAVVYEYLTSERVGLRVKGIQADLESIIKDEYTDSKHIPYKLLEIDGYRLYTNLSNMSRVAQTTAGNEQALGAVSVNQYLLGGVAPIMEKHRAAFSYGADSFKTADAIVTDSAGTLLGATGDYNKLTVVDMDVPIVVHTSESKIGNAKTEESLSSISLAYALPLMDKIKVAASFLSDVRGRTSTNDYTYQKNNDTTGAVDSVQKDTYNRETKGQLNLGAAPAVLNFDSGATVLSVSGELEVTDNLKLGTGLALKKATQDYSDNFTYKQHKTAAANGSAEANDKKETMDLSISADGTMFGLPWLVAEYKLSDNVMLRGGFDASTMETSGDGSYVYKNVQVVGPAAGTADDNTYIANKNTSSADITGEQANIDVYAGTEAQLSEKLMLGIGLRYRMDKLDFTMDWTGKTTDINGNVTAYGYQPMSKIGIPVVVIPAGVNLKMESITDTKTIILPVGLEYKATKALAIRLGASHRIATTKTTSDSTVTAYNAAALPTKSKLQSVTTSDVDETVTRTTNFAYGAGINVSKNLEVNLTNMLGSADLLDLSCWRIEAVLKF